MTEASYKIIKFKAYELPKQYEAMIFSKFLRSLRHGNDYFKLIDSDPYFHVYHAYFATILARPYAVINLAVLSDDEDVVLGWSLTEPGKLHYVYVNKEYRFNPKSNDPQPHIGSALTSEPFLVFTHITKMALSLWSSHCPHATFNPFA